MGDIFFAILRTPMHHKGFSKLFCNTTLEKKGKKKKHRFGKNSCLPADNLIRYEGSRSALSWDNYFYELFISNFKLTSSSSMSDHVVIR